MGGYIIARDSRESTISCYPNDSRRSFKSELDTDLDIEPEASRSTHRIVVRNDDDDVSFKATPRDAHLIDSYPSYEQLLPNIARGAFFLVEEGSPVGKDHCHLVSTSPNSQSRQRQFNQSRSVGASRINKPRRISPNTNADLPKPSEAQRPEIPKTPMSWSSEDDILLRDLKELRKLGWKEISAYFPKRTAHACQFRWRRLVSGTLKGHKQCPPMPSNRIPVSCLSIPLDQSISSKSLYIGALDDAGSTATSRFDKSSPGADSGGIVTPTTLSPPSSPNYTSDSCVLNRHDASVLGTPSPIHQRSTVPACFGSEKCNTKFRAELFDSESKRSVSDAFLERHLIRVNTETSHRPTRRESVTIHGTMDSDIAKTSPRGEVFSWTSEEDSLLLNRRLSFDEVSILLHHRSEEAIWSRMGLLRSTMPKFSGLECNT